jgi:hypothetical protein
MPGLGWLVGSVLFLVVLILIPGVVRTRARARLDAALLLSHEAQPARRNPSRTLRIHAFARWRAARCCAVAAPRVVRAHA